MSDNQYDNFKQGIKNDVTNYGVSVFLIGGLLLLIVIMLSGLFAVIKDDSMEMSNRILIGTGIVLIGVVMIISNKIRTFILQGWLILLVGVPILLLFFIIFYAMCRSLASI